MMESAEFTIPAPRQSNLEKVKELESQHALSFFSPDHPHFRLKQYMDKDYYGNALVQRCYLRLFILELVICNRFGDMVSEEAVTVSFDFILLPLRYFS